MKEILEVAIFWQEMSAAAYAEARDYLDMAHGEYEQ